MRFTKKWLIWQLATMILLLFLVACTPTTSESIPATTAPTTTEVPVLNPVTPTTEIHFTPNPDATKPPGGADQTENDEADSGIVGETDSRSDTHNSGAVLVYERAGGLMGIGSSIISWTMFADGRVESSDGRSWQVSPENITTLVDSIMALGFADFEASYIPQNTCCDHATHTINIYQDGEVYKVTVIDSTDAPAELYQAIDLIGEFLIALPTT